jgi:tetratricopeptide (TPR) repeat protein
MRLAGVAFVACVLSAVTAPAQTAPVDPKLIAIAQAALKAQQEGQLEQAEAGYRKFLEAEPRNVEVLGNLGVVYAGLGRYDDAIATYRKALGISSLSVPMRMNLGLAYYKAARCAEALEQFAVALRSDPGLYKATLLSADCHMQLGQYDTAIAQLTPIASAHTDEAAFNYVLGMALLQNKQANEGAVYLDRILKQGDSAEARLLMGMALRAGADYTGARDEFAKAVMLNPALPMAHSLYGQALLSTGDREQARAAFAKELALNPNDFESNLYLGVILKEEQNHVEAARYFDKALTVRPGDPGAQYQRATLLVATGDNQLALATLERLVKDNPSFTEAHVSLATVYYRLKRKADGDRHKAIAEQLTADAQAKQPGAQPPKREDQ